MHAQRLEQVVLARHGETEWNCVRRRQGQLDSPLTERGQTQALALATCVATLSVDAIVASPLGRAAATAAVCGERVGLAVMTVPELAEVDHGQMAGLTRPTSSGSFLVSLAAEPATSIAGAFRVARAMPMLINEPSQHFSASCGQAPGVRWSSPTR